MTDPKAPVSPKVPKAPAAKVGAKTSWWFCGRCGHRNRPRLNQDNSKCEQCGTSQALEGSHDYKPAETR